MKFERCIEIISFDILENMTETQVLKGFRILDDYCKKCSGYHGMEIGQGKGRNWTLILIWNSLKEEKDGSISMLKSDESNEFKMLIDGKTVVKNVLRKLIY